MLFYATRKGCKVEMQRETSSSFARSTPTWSRVCQQESIFGHWIFSCSKPEALKCLLAFFESCNCHQSADDRSASAFSSNKNHFSWKWRAVGSVLLFDYIDRGEWKMKWKQRLSHTQWKHIVNRNRIQKSHEEMKMMKSRDCLSLIWIEFEIVWKTFFFSSVNDLSLLLLANCHNLRESFRSNKRTTANDLCSTVFATNDMMTTTTYDCDDKKKEYIY